MVSIRPRISGLTIGASSTKGQLWRFGSTRQREVHHQKMRPCICKKIEGHIRSCYEFTLKINLNVRDQELLKRVICFMFTLPVFMYVQHAHINVHHKPHKPTRYDTTKPVIMLPISMWHEINMHHDISYSIRASAITHSNYVLYTMRKV